VSRHWGEVFVPKCGWVRFRWSRPLPANPGMARVTLDRAGRWHVSFPAAQPAVGRAPGPRPTVGIDRGVRTALVTSGGQHYRAPRISGRDAGRYLALQRKLARQEPGSKRRDKTRRKMAAVTARVSDRRRDWAEKISTRLVAEHGLIVLEKLAIPAMTRKPRPKPDPENDGAWLPNRARAKAGLNRGILASAWGTLGTRTKQKAESANVTVVLVEPRFTSQQCHACGHIAPENRKSQAVFACVACGHGDHADANAARNILARGLALIDNEAVPARNPGHGNKRPRKTARAGADTTRSAA
jgi:putative transposase